MSICDASKDLIFSYIDGETTKKQISNSGSNTSFNKSTIFYHLCQYPAVSTLAHYLVGVFLIFICIFSIAGNVLVVNVFSKYRCLRSAASALIVNLAVSDMLNGFLHPMVIYSSFKETWSFGRIGCELYAALCGLFGLVSIVTLMFIAIERCLVISIKPRYGDVHLVTLKIKYVIIFTWLYCCMIMIPPFYGWGSFVPEGFLTSCSFDYLTRSWSNKTYFVYLFILGFFVPVSIIIIFYTAIFLTIHYNNRNLKKNNVNKIYIQRKKGKHKIRRNDYQAAKMIILIIGMFLISWIPYCVVAVIGQFGDPELLTPLTTVLPCLFAKMSIVYNPAIYGLSHRRFRATLRNILHQTRNSSRARGSSKCSNVSLRKNCFCCRSKKASNILQKITLSNWERRSCENDCSVENLEKLKEATCSNYNFEQKQKTNTFARIKKSYSQFSGVNLYSTFIPQMESKSANGEFQIDNSMRTMGLEKSLLFHSDSLLHQKCVLMNDKMMKSFGLYTYGNRRSSAMHGPNSFIQRLETSPCGHIHLNCIKSFKRNENTMEV